MNDRKFNPSTGLNAIKELFLEMLTARLDEKGIGWLNKVLENLTKNPIPREFYMQFNLAPRFVGKDQLVITEIEREDLAKLVNDFNLNDWSTEMLVRNLILLYLPFEDKPTSLTILKNLFETAGLEESVALYSGIYLWPICEDLGDRGAEGIRTNMVAVFDAIALNNPFPKDCFNEIAWNQMVLKAFFMERPVYKIMGVDGRQNKQLARMISDYAHERWAAGRVTMPEMWRFVVGYLDNQIVKDLERMLQNEDKLQQQAALLACTQSDHISATELLTKYSALNKDLSSELSWIDIGKAWEGRQIQKETLYE